MEEPEDPAVRFLELWFEDKREGVDRELEEYKDLFPGFEGEVETEYSRLITREEGEGERIGDYRLVRELGRGAFGIVHLAEDVQLRRRVALKVLRLDRVGGSREALARFHREAQAASRLNHPGICTVLDADLEHDPPYIAMQYVEGETLQQHLESRSSDQSTDHRSRDGVREAVRLGEKMARALHVAHEEGIIHRDIKPGNVMIDRDGRPVLLDFGLAHIDDAASLLTRSGDVFGTPAYMSPEQVRGQRVDHRTDLWSLGVLLYESLTLVKPFAAPHRDALPSRITDSEPTKAVRINPAIPPDLQAVLEKTLEKDPARRYKTAHALAEDLLAVLEGRPVSAKPSTALTRTLRWARRQPAAAAVIALLMVGVPVVTGLSGFLIANAPLREEGRLTRVRESLEQHVEEGFFALLVDRFPQARESFESALVLDPEDPRALSGLVLTHNGARKYADTLALLAHHETMVEQHPEIGLLRVDALRGTGQEAEASALEGSLRGHVPSSAIGFFITGWRALHEDPEEALRRMTQAVLHAREPSPTVYFCARAVAARRAEDEDRIRETARVLLNTFDNAWAYFFAAFSLEEIDRLEAIDIYLLALKRDEELYWARVNLGVLYRQMGDMVLAIGHLEDARAQAPEDPEVHGRMGDAYWVADRADEAVAAWNEALRLDPEYDACHKRLSEALTNCCAWDAAMAHLARAVALNPLNALWRYKLGYLAFYRGDLDRAVREYTRALKVEPFRLEVEDALEKANEFIRKRDAFLRGDYDPPQKDYFSFVQFVLLMGEVERAAQLFHERLDEDTRDEWSTTHFDAVRAAFGASRIARRSGRDEDADLWTEQGLVWLERATTNLLQRLDDDDPDSAKIRVFLHYCRRDPALEPPEGDTALNPENARRSEAFWKPVDARLAQSAAFTRE